MVEDDDTETKTDDKTGQEGDKDHKDNPEDNKIDKETDNALDRAEAANKETARLQEQKSKLLDREEKLHAVQMVGGHTVAGEKKEEPKKLTDEEYSEALTKGEVNPMKEDGIKF